MRGEDVVRVLRAALVEDRLTGQTVAVVGPEQLTLAVAISWVAEVVGKRPLMFRLPASVHYLLAHVFEALMVVPSWLGRRFAC